MNDAYNFDIFVVSISNWNVCLVLITLLNGTDVGGVGVMFFDGQRSQLCACRTIGNKPYKGKVLTMGVNVG